MQIIKAQITLPVNGREMTFSEEELIAILEEHFSQAKTEQQEPSRPIHGPKAGVPFPVNPNGINPSDFQEARKDFAQEETRKIILEALDEVKKNPWRYGKPFWTLRPKKTWVSKTVCELVELACAKGDHNANGVEWALELAQRIKNGESWETICNEPDTANWYSLVEWKNCDFRIVGGSRKNNDNYPAAEVFYHSYVLEYTLDDTVPLVVRYHR